jgi:hypothetical protein
MRHISILFSTATLLLPLLSSASAAPDAAATAPPAGTAAAGSEKVVGPPEVAWKDLTKDQRMRFMKAVVNPKMKVVFQAFDADEFKKFGCATCHGQEAKARKFKMPNPDIHPLPSTPAAFQAMMKKEPKWPKWVKFMSEQVEPQMATLLNVPTFNPKKPEAGGFSCEACHTLVKPK